MNESEKWAARAKSYAQIEELKKEEESEIEFKFYFRTNREGLYCQWNYIKLVGNILLPFAADYAQHCSYFVS